MMSGVKEYGHQLAQCLYLRKMNVEETYRVLTRSFPQVTLEQVESDMDAALRDECHEFRRMAFGPSLDETFADLIGQDIARGNWFGPIRMLRERYGKERMRELFPKPPRRGG